MSGISSNSNGSLINKYKFGGKEIEVNGFCDNIGLGVYDFHFRYYDPQIGRWWSVDPKADKYFSLSLFNYTLNNPTNLVDPDGQEPIKPQAGTSATFIKVFNNTPSKMGLSFGKEASQALQRLGSTEWNSKQMRPLPTTTPYFNNREGRYIYTEKGGWIDMVHFLFYAGKAYDYKQQKADAVNLIKSLKESGVSTKDMPANLISKSLISPVGEAVQDGYVQEMTDSYAAKYSAYSYEDLPSDKFGADFGANYFDPNSKLTLGEQLLNYLNDKLKATNPERAPNYKSLPSKEPTDKPSRTNHSTFPVYIINNP